MTPQFTATYISEWREWLAENHATKSKIWLVFYKKATGKPCPSYNEAVEEALCWGWIASAKRDETRAKRLRQALKMLKSKQKLGMV